MLKGIGIVFILLGSTGLGLATAQDLEKRIMELQKLQQLMMLLHGKIRYMHQPLPEAFLHLGGSAPKPFGDFFLRTARDLQQRNGQSAEQIWKKNLNACLGGLHLSRQEMKELQELGGMLGCLDVEMQLNALNYYLEQLRQSVQRASETCKSRRRLYQYLGVLGGAALVIFII